MTLSSNEIFFCECEQNIIIYKNLIDIMGQILNIEHVYGVNNQKYIKQVCLRISKQGINVYSDTCNFINSSIFFDKNFFSKFEYNNIYDDDYNCDENGEDSLDDNDLCIGISLDVLKSCFKYVLRNDVLNISISKNKNEIFPNVIKFILNKNKGFDIKFNIVQNINYNQGQKINLLTTIPSERLSNLYKEIGCVKKSITMTTENSKLKFSSNLIDIAETWTSFDLDESFNCETQLNIKIISEFFKLISKLSSFNKNTSLYIDTENKKLIVRNNILLKSNSQFSDYGVVEIKITYDE